MLNFLKDHPFAVEAFFESSIVLTFSAPPAQLQHLIPKILELDTYNESHAFIAVAMVQTSDLRPKGFPRWMGNDFFLIGYRVFVRYRNNAGKNLRGLYILKSETDKKKMEWLGNIFTHYKYTSEKITTVKQHGLLTIASAGTDFSISIEEGSKESVTLPKNSPFADWKTARRFAGPLPFTFSVDPKTNKVLIVEGVRENWTPKPIQVIDYRIPFLESLHFGRPELANGFMIQKIPYYWKKGRTEIWQAH